MATLDTAHDFTRIASALADAVTTRIRDIIIPRRSFEERGLTLPWFVGAVHLHDNPLSFRSYQLKFIADAKYLPVVRHFGAPEAWFRVDKRYIDDAPDTMAYLSKTAHTRHKRGSFVYVEDCMLHDFIEYENPSLLRDVPAPLMKHTANMRYVAHKLGHPALQDYKPSKQELASINQLKVEILTRGIEI